MGSAGEGDGDGGGSQTEGLAVVLRPDSSHCIETVARNEFERGLAELLRGAGDEHLAEKTELLRLFLETFDFRELRAKSEKHILMGREVTFTVYMDEGAVRYALHVSETGGEPEA
jgi:hypothetical protein